MIDKHRSREVKKRLKVNLEKVRKQNDFLLWLLADKGVLNLT
jgi:hypothetical protein